MDRTRSSLRHLFVLSALELAVIEPDDLSGIQVYRTRNELLESNIYFS